MDSLCINGNNCDLNPRDSPPSAPPPCQAQLKLYRYCLLTHILHVWGEAPTFVTFNLVSKLSHPTLTHRAACSKGYELISSGM